MLEDLHLAFTTSGGGVIEFGVVRPSVPMRPELAQPDCPPLQDGRRRCQHDHTIDAVRPPAPLMVVPLDPGLLMKLAQLARRVLGEQAIEAAGRQAHRTF